MESYPVADPELVNNRKEAMKAVRQSASRGNVLSSRLLELEALAAPFFLGMDVDPDDSDMDLFP